MSDNFIPVFVFPSSLVFYADDQSTHKLVLTLCNPYEFAVRFQVLCSSHERNKYSVVDPEGSINSHCCVDIVIRHNAVTSQNIGQTDKFRIQMFQFSSNKVLGRKDVTAELLPGEPDQSSSPQRELFQQIPSSSASQISSQQNSSPRRQPQGRPGAPNSLIVIVTVICALTLLLPSQGDSSSFLPDYLKPTFNLKLVVSYVLGLVTMVFLRPT